MNPEQIKTINFSEGLLKPTLTGKKTITLRKYRSEAHSLQEGDIFIGSFKEGIDIPLQATRDTEVKPFSELTDEIAQEDGFNDVKETMVGLRKYYPDLTEADMMAIIRYEIAKIQGIPAVRLNNSFNGEMHMV